MTDVSLLKREKYSSAEVWNSAAACGQVFGPPNPEQVLKQLTGLLKCVQPRTIPPPSTLL